MEKIDATSASRMCTSDAHGDLVRRQAHRPEDTEVQGDGRCEFFDRTTAGVGRTTGDFASLALPTLLLAGDRAMFCPVEIACTAYRALPAGEMGIVPNTGHEITPAVIDIMIAFRARHAAGE